MVNFLNKTKASQSRVSNRLVIAGLLFNVIVGLSPITYYTTTTTTTGTTTG